MRARRIGEVPLAVEVHLALMQASDEANHANARYFARWDLTPQQYNVLRILYFGEDAGARLSDIGRELLQRVPDVSRLVDRLELAGLAYRLPDDADRRAVRVRLAAAGRRLLEGMDADLLAANERWYAGLTLAEQEQLRDFLHKARASIAAAMTTDEATTVVVGGKPAASR